MSFRNPHDVRQRCEFLRLAACVITVDFWRVSLANEYLTLSAAETANTRRRHNEKQ